jgi:glutamate racemase
LITLGVFDSGVGGLSVLRDMQTLLPTVPSVYVADNAFAPYGEREVATIQQRTHQITDHLRRHWGIKALVIACNTATAHAIDGLRMCHPDLPIIGVEPALKPAAAMSVTGQVGVLATRRTLSSERFHRLQREVEAKSGPDVRFWSQACDGLADAIERNQTDEVSRLCQRYIANLFNGGPSAKLIDTIVLGCTHYPFAIEALQAATLGQTIRFIDTGLPVARRVREVLEPLLKETSATAPPQVLTLLSTGDAAGLSSAGQRWINPLLVAHSIVP